MCAGGPGSIPGTYKLDSGFHPSVVGKMRSSKYVVGWPLRKSAGLSVRPLYYHLQTTTRGFLAVSASALKIAIVIQGALEVWSLYLYILLARCYCLHIILYIYIYIYIYTAACKYWPGGGLAVRKYWVRCPTALNMPARGSPTKPVCSWERHSCRQSDNWVNGSDSAIPSSHGFDTFTVRTGSFNLQR